MADKTDAEIAFEIAEARIEKARTERLPYLSLSPSGFEDLGVKWEDDRRLKHLDRPPPTLADLTWLQRLDLSGTQVADIEPLQNMEAMQTLYLRDTQVADIEPLRNMEAMRALYLNDTQVADIEPLQNMEAMQTLYLNDTQVADIEPLQNMEAMQTLYLRDTQVADIEPLRNMEAMRALYLGGTQVADIEPLRNMEAMQRLWLTGTQVADIEPLRNMEAMQRLWLNDTKADLFALVAPGAAWAEDDRALQDLEFRETPLTAPGEPLADVYEKSDGDKDRTGKTLDILRAERDRRRPPPPPPPAPNRPFVFLSYSREDADRAAALREALEADGIEIWQDVEMRAGVKFRDEIDKRIDAASAALVLWSEASVGSDYVVSEAERARGKGKIVPALLDDCAVPAPFDVYNAPPVAFGKAVSGRVTRDGQTSDGPARTVANTSDRGYGVILSTLREMLTPGAEVGAGLTDTGKIAPAQKPVGGPRAKPAPDERTKALSAQIARVAMLREEMAHESNADARLARRLERYAETLRGDDPLWETVDDAFAIVRPLVRDEEIDDGLIALAARIRAGHDDLEDRLRPEQPADKADVPAPELDPADPDAGGAAARGVLGGAIEALAGAATAVDPSSVAYLQEIDAGLATMAEDAKIDTSPEQETARRSFTGKLVRGAAGFIASVGALASTMAFGMSAEGAAFLKALGEAWKALVRILYP